MIAGGAVQIETDLAGHMEPDGNLLFLAGCGAGPGQAIDSQQHPPAELHQRGAGLAKAAVVFGEPAEAGARAGGESAQAGLADLGPGQHGGAVERAVRGGAAA